MAKPDWLSIEEITRLWVEETGHDASAFREDLEAWFAEFVKQPPKPGSPLNLGHADSTNRLIGMLGARHLERSTFETYCEERGLPLPRFWSGGRPNASPGDAPMRSAPEPAPSDPAQSPSADASSRPTAESDPNLAEFQKQIAQLSERLETSRADTPSFDAPSSDKPSSGEPSSGEPSSGELSSGEPSSGDRPGLGVPPSEPATKREADQQELIEQAAAAAAEARELKAQLEAAERRIAEFSAERATEPDADRQRSGPSFRPSQQALVGYRGQDAASHLPRQQSRRRKRPVKTVLAVALAMPFIALLLWGGATMFEFTRMEPLSPGFGTGDPLAGSGPQGGGAEQAPPALESGGGGSHPETATRSGDGQFVQDLEAAQREIARLTEEVETSDLVTARLQAELALARQQAEAARRAVPANAGAASEAPGEPQDGELGPAATEASARADALQNSLEANRKQTADLAKALETAKVENSELRAAVQQAEERATEAQKAAQTVQAEAEKIAAAAAAATAKFDQELAETRAEATRLRATLQEVQDLARAERQDLALATTVSSARVATLHKELEAARQQLAEGSRTSEATAADASSLRAALQQAEERAADAQGQAADAKKHAAEAEKRMAAAKAAKETAETSAAEARKALATAEANAATLAEQVDAAIALATNVDKSLAGARIESTRLRRQNARLSDELASVKSETSRLQAALQLAEGRAEAGRQDLLQSASASAARVAELQRELEASRRQFTDLSEALGSARDEAAQLREELSARQQEAAAGSTAGAGATPPLDSTGRGVEPDPGPQGASEGGAPKIEELLASAESSTDLGPYPRSEPDALATPDAVVSGDSQAAAPPTAAPAAGDQIQSAEVAPTQVVSEAVFQSNTVATDDLLLEPGEHVGRELVVTGTVVWLLWRYRLQSDSGPGSMVIDVDGLQSTDHTVLKKAMEEVGLLGQVRARIKGTVERQGDTSYHLAASEIVLVE